MAFLRRQAIIHIILILFLCPAPALSKDDCEAGGILYENSCIFNKDFLFPVSRVMKYSEASTVCSFFFRRSKLAVFRDRSQIPSAITKDSKNKTFIFAPVELSKSNLQKQIPGITPKMKVWLLCQKPTMSAKLICSAPSSSDSALAEALTNEFENLSKGVVANTEKLVKLMADEDDLRESIVHIHVAIDINDAYQFFKRRQCPNITTDSGWKLFQTSCFLVTSSQDTQTEMLNYCYRIGGRMAALQYGKQVGFAKRMLKRYGSSKNQRFWSLRWDEADKRGGFNSAFGGKCETIRASGEWKQSNCKQKLPALCQVDILFPDGEPKESTSEPGPAQSTTETNCNPAMEICDDRVMPDDCDGGKEGSCGAYVEDQRAVLLDGSIKSESESKVVRIFNSTSRNVNIRHSQQNVNRGLRFRPNRRGKL